MFCNSIASLPLKVKLLTQSSRSLSTFSQCLLAQVKVNHEFHSIIKYVRPEDLPIWAPQRSCDLKPLPTVDPNWLKLEFRPFADIINALPEDERKLFTLAFCPRKDGIAVIMDDTISAIRRHKYDFESREVKITWMTVKIRSFQEIMVRDPTKVGKNRKLRVGVKELIEKRKKYFNRLRCADYKRFEWLLDVLAYLYKPTIKHTRVERKASINVIVNLMCHDIRQKKLDDYKELLESEKIPFLQDKLSILQQIKVDEESIKLSCSVDDQIEETIRRLEKLSGSHIVLQPVAEDYPPILELKPASELSEPESSEIDSPSSDSKK